jgi:hypothetical protein
VILQPYAATIKLVAAGLLAGALIWAGVTVAEWRQGYHQKEAAEAAAARVARESAAAMAILAEQHRVALATSQGFQNERDELRKAADAAGPAPVLRVCRPASVSAADATGRTIPGPDAVTPGAGGREEAVDLDTGPIFAIADRCDAVSAQLRALQAWVRGRP